MTEQRLEDKAGEVREGEELPIAKLAAYLRNIFPIWRAI